MILITLFIIIIAILTGYVIYKYIIEKYILMPFCLVDTDSCTKIEYYSFENSVLFSIPPSNYWIWYNDGKAYTYGELKSKSSCENGYTNVYVTDLTTKEPQLLGYQCVTPFNQVLDFFVSKGPKKHIYYKSDPLKIPDMFEVLNKLEMNQIINLKL